MPWSDWIRTVEVEPSLYGADFSRLGEQIDALLDAGCRVFHFDVGDGHFVEPITIGPIVLQSISPRIHARGGVIDVHLMVERPAKYFDAIAAAGGDSVTFHFEAVDDVPATIAAAREHGLQVGRRVQPGDASPRRSPRSPATPISCSAWRSIPATRASRSARRRSTASRGCGPRCRTASRSRSTAASAARTSASCATRGATLFVAGVGDLRARRPAGRVSRSSSTRSREHLASASSSRGGARARRIRSRRSAQSSSRDGEIVGEGVTEAGGRHAEVVALDGGRRAARGATLYVTLEPCAHHGTTPPCTEAILAAGVERVVFGARDPNPEAAGGQERLARTGVDVEFVDSCEARGAERGVADVGARPAPVRDLQGRR